MESADMETCRLCFSDDFSDESQLIDIFTEFGLYKNIAEIINEHIGEVRTIFNNYDRKREGENNNLSS